MPFAANCPADCPPADAVDVSGDILRFVRNNPPTPKDLATYTDLEKGGDDACLACGLSVLRRMDDVVAARKAMPWFKKQLVAKATLTPSHGRIKQTGSHKEHHSLWVELAHRESLHTLFAVVPA